MKTVKTIFIFAVLFSAVSSAFGQKSEKAFAVGEVLVKFKSGSDFSRLAETNAFAGASLVEKLGDLSWVRINLPEHQSVFAEQSAAEERSASAEHFRCDRR